MQHALKLLDIPLWLERTGLAFATPIVDAPKNCVLLAETEAQFSAQHHGQLAKILDFLGLKDYYLFYQGAPMDFTQAQMILSFGQQNLTSLPAQIPVCTTLSISAMLQDPSCKRQVLHDLKPIKDRLA